MRDDDPPLTVFKLRVRSKRAADLWRAAKLLFCFFAFFFMIFLVQYGLCKFNDSTKTWRACVSPNWRSIER